MHVEHLHRGEFVEYAARAQAARVRAQLLGQCDMQAVGEEGDEDVRVDPVFELVMDRAHREVALEIFERLFDVHELDVVTPQLGGLGAGEIGA